MLQQAVQAQGMALAYDDYKGDSVQHTSINNLLTYLLKTGCGVDSDARLEVVTHMAAEVGPTTDGCQ